MHDGTTCHGKTHNLVRSRCLQVQETHVVRSNRVLHVGDEQRGERSMHGPECRRMTGQFPQMYRVCEGSAALFIFGASVGLIGMSPVYTALSGQRALGSWWSARVRS